MLFFYWKNSGDFRVTPVLLWVVVVVLSIGYYK
jgi:hypothetical protein